MPKDIVAKYIEKETSYCWSGTKGVETSNSNVVPYEYSGIKWNDNTINIT